MQDLQVLQRRLVCLVVVLGPDAVGVGLTVLAEEDQRGCVGGLSGEDQVQQNERVRIPVMYRGEEVQADPQHDDHGLHDDELPGTEYCGYPVGELLALGSLIVAPLVSRVQVPAGSHAITAVPASVTVGTR